MSIRVKDRSGVEWTISRDWFGVPAWTRSGHDRPSADVPLVGYFGDELSGTLALVIGLFVAAALVLIVLVWFVVPVVVVLAGLLVATFALAARLLRVSAWTIRARGGDRTLSWRIRGTRRSGRAMREVALKLARGEEPTVDGIAGGTP